MKKICVFLMFVLVVCGGFSAYATTDIAANVESSECVENITGTYSGDANFKAKWAPNNIQLNWHDGYSGTQITPTNTSANTCNYGGALTIPNNPPERIGYIFDGWKIPGLPAGYTRLEYLESTGTQYIDTGVNTATSSSTVTKFEARAAYTNTARNFIGAYNNSTIAHYCEFRENKFGFNGSTADAFGYFSPTLTVNTPYNVSMQINGSHDTVYGINVDGENYSHSTTGHQDSRMGNFLLFMLDGTYKSSGLRIYSAKITINNTMIRNFIPAKRNSDNVVGMYDTVSQTFFTNTGTGDFIAGPVVQ